MVDEIPYDEEGSDGNGVNPNAVQPVRRFYYNALLNIFGGYHHGNGYVWPFNSGYNQHMNTQGTHDCKVMNGLMDAMPIDRLIPSSLSGIGILVSSGAGSMDGTDYVAAACTSAGDYFIAYANPSVNSFSINATKLNAQFTAKWMNPTNGALTTVGSFVNTGVRQFTPPGDNGTGNNDWLLIAKPGIW